MRLKTLELLKKTIIKRKLEYEKVITRKSTIKIKTNI